MARAFHRTGRATSRRYVATLDPDERDLVATLMEQTAAILEPPTGGETGDAAFDELVAGMSLGEEEAGPLDDEDRDPALDRLLPNANPADDAAAAEFRRLTEGGLRHRKAAVLARSVGLLRGSGNEVALDADEAREFLTALTDVRLVLGDRLGLRDDEDLERLEAAAETGDAADPLAQALALYDFLTWLQETLATALLRD